MLRAEKENMLIEDMLLLLKGISMEIKNRKLVRWLAIKKLWHDAHGMESVDNRLNRKHST